MAKQKVTPEQVKVLKFWRKASAKSKKPVGKSAVVKAMKITTHEMNHLFPDGNLTDLKREHGIRLSFQEIHYTAEELLSKLDEVVSGLGAYPNWRQLKRTHISDATWKKTLAGPGGSKEDVVRRYKKHLEDTNPASPNLEIVKRLVQGPRKLDKTAKTSRRSPASGPPTYEKTDGETYGPPIDFSNLRHEPTNEQGVVFLFGMVSKALGFKCIDRIGQPFPDCEGKRKIDRKGRLQSVTIEFEFTSRDYKAHAHPLPGDPPGGKRPADVIVCWEDNWGDDCPLEVIELKKAIKGLENRSEFKP